MNIKQREPIRTTSLEGALIWCGLIASMVMLGGILITGGISIPALVVWGAAQVASWFAMGHFVWRVWKNRTDTPLDKS